VREEIADANEGRAGLGGPAELTFEDLIFLRQKFSPSSPFLSK